ncbi:MAG: IPTL-CTERM sorting domain-containing protein, partial [Myxococcales bacterium]
GEDGLGNLYIVDYGGEIFRLVNPAAVPSLGDWGVAVLASLLAATGIGAGAARGRGSQLPTKSARARWAPSIHG